MISAVENSILKGLIHNETYTRKILPYVKDVYFTTTTGRTAFRICQEYFLEYNSCPTKQDIAVELEKLKNISDDEFKALAGVCEELFVDEGSSNLEFLTNETERWCKERAVYNALMESINIHDGGSKEHGVDSIPELLSEALAVGFDDHIGHDYLNDYQERYDFYHRKEERISFGIDYLDKITKGGVPNKTLNIALAGTGVGKSLFMCSFASSVLLQGKNVLYITAEMAEERIAERIDANLLDTTLDDIVEIPRPMFETKVTNLQKKTQGQLYIKEYPTATAHAGHFDALLKELALKKSFVPDIIFIDYLNICASQRYRAGSNVNSYTVVKAIAEELRGLAGKHKVPVISATQTTRSGFSSTDVELTDTSESFGLPATADFMFALISTDELEQMGQIMVKQLKNRYNDKTKHNKFVVGIDRPKMRLYDVEQTAQSDILDSEPTYSYNDTESKLKKKNFDGFNF